MPKVSICIPTYNGAEHLSECLRSVTSQSYRDFEVIAVDDHSSDATWELLKQHATQDGRIRLFRNERNLGLVGNWNKCIELAQGEWIKFAFQDDVLRPNCVEAMLQVASRPIVFCKRNFLFEESTDKEIIEAYRSIPNIDDLTGGANDLSADVVQEMVLRERRNFFGEPTASLFVRSLVSRFGGFNQDLAQFCDLEYWVRVAINTGLAYVPSALASFRYHSRGMSASNRDPLVEERVDVFDRLILLHEYAYNRHFAPLRRRAVDVDPPRRFKMELAEKACWVKARAHALANAPESPDTRWIVQWNRVVQRYPHIGWSVWHLPYDARRWIAQRVGWRWG